MKDSIRIALIAVMIVFPMSTVLAQGPGEGIYKARCAMCHAADGSGNTATGKATKTPPFNSPEMLKMSDADFIADTKNGKGKMPAYSGKISDLETKDVIAYIRTLQKK